MRMSTGLGVATSAVLVAAGSSKIAAIKPMRTRAAHLLYSVNAYRLIGLAELAAAAGILGGRREPALGAVSAGGVTALMVGAVLSHRRVHDPVTELLPALAVGGAAACTAISFASGARS